MNSLISRRSLTTIPCLKFWNSDPVVRSCNSIPSTTLLPSSSASLALFNKFPCNYFSSNASSSSSEDSPTSPDSSIHSSSIELLNHSSIIHSLSLSNRTSSIPNPRFYERFYSFRGISRITEIFIHSSRLNEFLEFYRNQIQPNAYKDSGFSGAYLLLKKNYSTAKASKKSSSLSSSLAEFNEFNEEDSLMKFHHITLWRDNSSLQRNNSTPEYQQCMEKFSLFLSNLSPPPDTVNYHLVDFIKGNSEFIENKYDEINNENNENMNNTNEQVNSVSESPLMENNNNTKSNNEIDETPVLKNRIRNSTNNSSQKTKLPRPTGVSYNY